MSLRNAYEQWHLYANKAKNRSAALYAAPIGAFFCHEIRAFTGFGARSLQLFPKSLVTVEYYSNTQMAVDGR